MKTELLGQEKNIITVKVEFEVEEFAASLNKIFQELEQKVNIPGFRRGHIPRKILEMRVGKEHLHSDAFDKMLPQAIEQIVNDYDMETIAPPSLKQWEIREGEPVVCELVFEVAPEVSLPDLESIEVKKLRAQLTEKRLEEEVEALQKACSTLNSVERPLAEGDTVSTTAVLSFVGSDEKQEPQESVFDLSDPQLRSEIKEALLGKTKGETVSVEFVVDSAHQDKRIAGKKVHDDITINQVQERIFPGMTKEFYKQALDLDLDSEEAFREEVRKQMLHKMDEILQKDAVFSAINQIVEKSKLEIPATLLDRQIALQKQQDATTCRQRFNLSIEEYLRNASILPDFYEQELREKANNVIRRALVLNAIRKKFDIEVTGEELEAEIANMANLYQTKPENIKALYYKDPDQLRQLTDEMSYAKIVEWLQDKIKIEEVDELPVETPLTETTKPTDEPVSAQPALDVSETA